MKFVVERTSTSYGRVGYLLDRKKSVLLKTPLLIQYTKGGSIPYLSNEVFKFVTNDIQILLLSLPTINHMTHAIQNYEGKISTFFGFNHFPSILITKDICETNPCGFNEKNVIPLFTRRGRQNISPKEFMDLVEVMSPDIYISLNDANTTEGSSKKRIRKSVSRSADFLDYCYKRHIQSTTLSKTLIFASIVGGYDKHARSQCIQHVRDKPEVAGFLLDGFHNDGWSAAKVNNDVLLSTVSHCIQQLDVNKPKIMLGAYHPLVVVELIKAGVDIFDTSYAYLAAMKFKALTFAFDVSEKTHCQPFLDIMDNRFKDDFTPLISSCKCFSCKHYTKAYIHHLHTTQELLGKTLLIIHNIHHYMEFFKMIRLAVMNDDLENFHTFFKQENNEYFAI